VFSEFHQQASGNRSRTAETATTVDDQALASPESLAQFGADGLPCHLEGE
jgi:hypothetical protein